VDPSLLRDLLTVALGVVTGALSGMFGVGGAVISTPGIRALGAAPLTAVGTTLPSILPGAVAGTLRYRREGLIEWGAVTLTVPSGIVAAVVGALLSGVVPGDGHLLQIATAALLGLSSYRMYNPREPDRPPSGPAEGHERDRARSGASQRPGRTRRPHRDRHGQLRRQDR